VGMKRSGFVLGFFVLATMAAACGGGSDVINSPSVLTGGFTPEVLNPGAKTTAMGVGITSGALVTVAVNITNTNGVYGAAFDVTFDPAMASWVSSSPGSVLETGGHTPTYQVDDSQPGKVVVGASRNGSVSAVDVVGTRNLINLTFRVTQPGSSQLTFAVGSAQLFGPQAPPQPIPGVSFFGGALQAN